jgi:hypothetical protein
MLTDYETLIQVGNVFLKICHERKQCALMCLHIKIQCLISLCSSGSRQIINTFIVPKITFYPPDLRDIWVSMTLKEHLYIHMWFGNSCI